MLMLTLTFYVSRTGDVVGDAITYIEKKTNRHVAVIFISTIYMAIVNYTGFGFYGSF